MTRNEEVAASEEVAARLEPLALDALHQRLGARFVGEGGVAAPADYGDPAAEITALRDDYAVVDLSWASRIELRGRDRQRFLNGLLTSNVRDLSAGRGVYGFLLDQRGRVLADAYVTALEDRLWLELPAGTAGPLRQHLERYRVIDDVELAGLDDMTLIGVLGPGAGAALGEAAASLALDATARATLDGCEVQLTHRLVFGGVEGFVLWAPSSLAEDIFVGLMEAGPASSQGRHAARAAGLHALDARRVALGRGRFGVDFGPDTVANETGLVEQAIDFTKGCYLGQEIVARIFYKGQPSQPVLPLEVRGRSDAPKLPGALHAILEDGTRGERAGTLTSAAASEEPAVWLAIGAVSRRALDAGARLELEGGGAVGLRS